MRGAGTGPAPAGSLPKSGTSNVFPFDPSFHMLLGGNIAEEWIMSVKVSVSMSEQQDAFVRSLVEQGRFASASAVVQRGLDLLRRQTEREEAELAALRAFFEKRRDGAFEDAETAGAATREMIEKRRARHGL